MEPVQMIVTSLSPEFVRVWVLSARFPNGTLPKLILDGFAVREPLVKPVPWTVRLPKVKPEPTNVNIPWIFWLLVGAKAMLKVAVSPALKVNGMDKPCIAKLRSDRRTVEMVTGKDRVLVRATVKLLEWETLTLPNANVDGALCRGSDVFAADIELGKTAKPSAPARRRESLGNRRMENIDRSTFSDFLQSGKVSLGQGEPEKDAVGARARSDSLQTFGRRQPSNFTGLDPNGVMRKEFLLIRGREEYGNYVSRWVLA